MRGKGGGPENGNEQKRDRTVTVELRVFTVHCSGGLGLIES